MDNCLIRLVGAADLPAVAGLYSENFARHGVRREFTLDDLGDEWSHPTFDRDEHVRVAELGGRVVGFVQLGYSSVATVGEAGVFGYVSEAHRGLGVATALASWAIARAREDPAVRSVTTVADAAHTEDVAVVEHLGFSYEWSSYRMLNRSPGGVDEPIWPDGIVADNTRTGDDLLGPWMAAHDGSFGRSRGFRPAQRDHYRHALTRPNNAPDLIWIAFDGREVAGYVWCSIETVGGVLRGVVPQLGTTERYRGIGLGRALLRHGVRELARRGARSVSLQVDAANDQALRLYERNGFERRREARHYALEV